MAIHDRIRLTGLLRENPVMSRVFPIPELNRAPNPGTRLESPRRAFRKTGLYRPRVGHGAQRLTATG